jgi:hypothetical protein
MSLFSTFSDNLVVELAKLKRLLLVIKGNDIAESLFISGFRGEFWYRGKTKIIELRLKGHTVG